MSYFTASQIGKALAKTRVSAGLSQAEIARRIEKGERTVQSWEKGCTSPDSDEIMDWCTACGVSPITVFRHSYLCIFPTTREPFGMNSSRAYNPFEK